MRDDRLLIQTPDDLLELIAHALRLQLSYLSKDQALAVADTILRTLKAQGRTVVDPAAQIMRRYEKPLMACMGARAPAAMLSPIASAVSSGVGISALWDAFCTGTI